MQPSEMPQGQPAPEQQAPQQGGGASKLVVDINSGLSKLMQLAGSSQDMGDDDKQELAQILQAFQGWVEKMGQAPGAQPKAPSQGVAPAEAGAAQVQPAM